MITPSLCSTSELRKIAIEAKSLVGMVQGTMALEGQGLDKATLRRLKRRMVRRLLGISDP